MDNSFLLLLKLLISNLKADELLTLESNLNYRTTRVERKNAIGIYRLRSALHNTEKELFAQFNFLLENLENADDDFVIIHSLISNEQLYLIFSNPDISFFWGILIFNSKGGE